MKIGYSVQGSTDRAFLEGLKRRWCRDALTIEGGFRGSTKLSLRREYRKICEEFLARSVDVMVFLTDADEGSWHETKKDQISRFPDDCASLAILGVAERNVECWICADPEWLARELDVDKARFTEDDPKGAFEHTMGIDRDDKKEEEIAELVRRAPMKDWLSNPSFQDFYEQVRDKGQQLGCAVENLLDG